jgi:hypothetical protein
MRRAVYSARCALVAVVRSARGRRARYAARAARLLLLSGQGADARAGRGMIAQDFDLCGILTANKLSNFRESGSGRVAAATIPRFLLLSAGVGLACAPGASWRVG